MTHLRRRPWLALPETLWLSPTSLAKVDNDNFRAFVIDKAHLPHPENQSGSKRLITESMAAVGIEVNGPNYYLSHLE